VTSRLVIQDIWAGQLFKHTSRTDMVAFFGHLETTLSANANNEHSLPELWNTIVSCVPHLGLLYIVAGSGQYSDCYV
jgi:hypothetical protein